MAEKYRRVSDGKIFTTPPYPTYTILTSPDETIIIPDKLVDTDFVRIEDKSPEVRTSPIL